MLRTRSTPEMRLFAVWEGGSDLLLSFGDAAPELPIGECLTPELERSVDFGTEIAEAGFYAAMADRPLGMSLRKLFERAGHSLPESLAIYARFETWLIPHRVSLIRRSGLHEPVSVGLEVEYLNEDRTCSIAALFPSFQYTEHESVSLGTRAAAGLSMTGELTDAAPGGVTGFAHVLSNLTTSHLEMNTGGEPSLRLEATIATPIISAVGLGSSRCEWRFDRDREPLFGRDIETWSVVVLPKRQTSLRLRARFYLISRMLFVPTRRQSDWLELTCPLVR